MSNIIVNVTSNSHKVNYRLLKYQKRSIPWLQIFYLLPAELGILPFPIVIVQQTRWQM